MLYMYNTCISEMTDSRLVDFRGDIFWYVGYREVQGIRNLGQARLWCVCLPMYYLII